MAKMKLLQEGDVFALKPGMKVYAYIPECFVYANSRNSSKITKTDLEVGVVLKNSGGSLKIGDYKPKKKLTFDTSTLAGNYVVIHTNFGGGGTGMGLHDVFPDGWHVTARRLHSDGLASGRYNPEGQQVEFYQTGCFTAMNPNVKVIGKMKKTYL